MSSPPATNPSASLPLGWKIESAIQRINGRRLADSLFCHLLNCNLPHLPPSPTLDQHLRFLYERLEPLSDTPLLDAQVLLAHVLEHPRTWVLAHPEARLSAQQAARLHASLERLQAGEPLPYVLGSWEFYSLQFALTAETLIPRPETELLVDQALTWLRLHPARHRVADVGTGSGCIAIALCYSLPALQVVATDISAGALRTALKNARTHSAQERISFVQADLLTPFEHPHARFDLVCANLPYIPTATLRRLPVFAREPVLALDGGPEGLDLISRLLEQVRQCLSAGGLLLLEIEARQGQAARALALGAFPAAEVEVLPDLAGHDRLLRVQV